MIKTRLTEMLNLKYPIFQGGMAWVATPTLVAAVSEAGALGILGTGHLNGEETLKAIRETREKTTKPFGVNIMLQSPRVSEIIKVCLEEKVHLVTFGAGNPAIYIPAFQEKRIMVFPVVNSVSLAIRLKRTGVEGIIAEGREAGGHVGKNATLPLIPQIVDATNLPVVAAGGFADGRGLLAALSLGAVGVQMGTRFICTQEAEVHLNYKEAIIKAGDLSTMVTGETFGHPVRVIRNQLANKVLELEKKGASLEEFETIGVGALKKAVNNGDMINGSLMAGEISGLINDIPSVAQVLCRIEEEFLIGFNLLKIQLECQD
ncbi:MAG: Nitronate monooxygenase [candidate division WS2 bacterium]|nr:Nitronate monooxygenase [Candidatus Lithacetigena glycinireducens]MBT9174814.1 Nitronate monooxygenase [Candidatus Lithacetigena glycinireducens]